jgi:hypothetical protein
MCDAALVEFENGNVFWCFAELPAQVQTEFIEYFSQVSSGIALDFRRIER